MRADFSQGANFLILLVGCALALLLFLDFLDTALEDVPRRWKMGLLTCAVLVLTALYLGRAAIPLFLICSHRGPFSLRKGHPELL